MLYHSWLAINIVLGKITHCYIQHASNMMYTTER